MLVEADGVHLGQDDIPIEEVKKILPSHMIIGVSTHSYKQAMEAEKEGPDYIAIGPIYDTNSKYGKLIRGIGTEVIKEIKNRVKLPVVAIGGIKSDQIEEILDSGADSPVLVSYLYQNNDIENNCSRIIDLLLK